METDLKRSARPRPLGASGRVLAAGARTCSDVELVALVLGGGARTDAGRALAERLLDATGGVERLDRLDRRTWAALGERSGRRAAALAAALEVGRRAAATPLRAGGPVKDAAAALILVHNHPSGDPTPSAEDRAITERLRQVGELVGIRVLDHVVIGRARYASMAEEGRW